MKNYLLYKDDNMTVEIDYLFHQFLKATQPKFIELNDKEFKIVLSVIIPILKEKYGFVNEEGNKLIGNIPVIKSGHALMLQEPYDCFNEVLHYLCLFPNLDERTEQLMEDINECFKEQGITCHILPHKIFDVKGFLIRKEDNSQTIMLFGFQEDNQNLDFLENL